MSNRRSERKKAIEADLAELTPTIEEDIIEATALTLAEESTAIQEKREFQRRVNAIYMQNKQLGITPEAWLCAQQWPGLEECLIRDALAERWESDMMIEHTTDYTADEPPDVYDDPTSEIWEPMEFLDDWSGSTIPMFAIEDL